MFFSVLLLAMTLAPPQTPTSSDLTPLMRAADKGDVRLVGRLLAEGANVNQKAKNGETALYEAIERRSPNKNYVPVVDALLRAGADPDQKSIFDLTPLVISLTRNYGDPTVTLRLLSAGATVLRQCETDDGLVSLATQDSSIEVMMALLAKGSPVDCQNKNGYTALDWAALNGQSDRVLVLLKAGADPRLRTQEGKTALQLASTTNPDSLVQARFEQTRSLLTKAVQRALQAI